ncbi:unnamed protein product [Discosporangium mesarthrocarpum]
MATWDGNGMSQDDFMRKDEVIVLDEDDTIIGHANKYKTHRFIPGQPRGILHRAFSVFMFDEGGKLLLQKRASTKITFPNVWTNTCCSHPLYGHEPAEVDPPEAVANGTVMGVKHAAIRKLYHELGIPAEHLPIDTFKFLTRLHYYASDSITHGPNAPWGEHEIDYILFIQVASSIPVKPHPDEVDGVKWVSPMELDSMMLDKGKIFISNSNLWSPWFRIIMVRFAKKWWLDLKAALTTDKYVDTVKIHRFDPPSSHRGGAGVTGVLEEGTSALQLDKSKKQGAYGRVPTIKNSKLAQLVHLDEVIAALRCKMILPISSKVPHTDSNVVFCDAILGKVSRSFAAVIRQLPKGLFLDIVVFYLVLRGLDTVEDDMQAFEGDIKVKIKMLEDFHKIALTDKNWTLTGVGEGNEKTLLEQFHSVTTVFQSLEKGSQEVIADVTKRMGAGMAEFVLKDLGQGTTTTLEYNKYCHYVAGLVGEGLSRLFSSTGTESPQVAQELELANSMGLFLQKTNIIRDYLEDYVDGRAFWPQEVWRKHSKTGQLGEFALPQFQQRAVACLNELVTDALELVPECLAYMHMIEHPEVFKFCAIPQAMAIATLAEVYNNLNVFKGVIKIRKGLACRIVLDCNDMEGLSFWFHKFASSIARDVPRSDPSALRTKAACLKITKLTEHARSEGVSKVTMLLNAVVPIVLSACVYYLFAQQ